MILQGVVRQFAHALNSCSPQQFLELGTLHQEMLQQEKALDFYVELLRKDQLDENVQLEPIEKVVTYFNSIYAVQFSSVTNGVALLTDHAKILLAACSGLTALGNRVQSMMQVCHCFLIRSIYDNSILLLTYLQRAGTKVAMLQSLLRKSFPKRLNGNNTPVPSNVDYQLTDLPDLSTSQWKPRPKWCKVLAIWRGCSKLCWRGAEWYPNNFRSAPNRTLAWPLLKCANWHMRLPTKFTRTITPVIMVSSIAFMPLYPSSQPHIQPFQLLWLTDNTISMELLLLK